MKIIGIAAVAKNGTIGNNGDIPWHCKDDLSFFKSVTKGNAVLMGRKTFESLPNGPFEDRVNVVVSREHEPIEPPHVNDVEMGDFYVFNDLDRAINWSTSYSRFIEADQFYVIGGSTIYDAANKYITDWLITHIPLEIEGDVKFPIDLDQKPIYRSGKIHTTPFTKLRSLVTQQDYVGTIPFFHYFNGDPDKLVILDKAGNTDDDVILSLESNLYDVRITDGDIVKNSGLLKSLTMITE